MNLKLITLPMWVALTTALTSWQSTQQDRITAGLSSVSSAITQALAVGGTTRFATEAALLAAAPGAAGATAWAQDTGTWYQSTGAAWQLIGGGAISEETMSIKVARFRASRTPTENAAYLNGLLAGGNVRVILQGRREWLVDRSVIVWNDSELDLNGSTVKFSQVPVNDGASNPNAVVSSKQYGYVVNSGVAVARNMTLRNGILDVGGYGAAGTGARYNGYTLTGVENVRVENVTCRNGTGYLQWLPGCSYGTVRNTVSENGEENFELAEHTHHIIVENYRSKNSAVNGILVYQGVHDVLFINCRCEGSGNGLNISAAYGDCYNITTHNMQVEVSGVPLVSAGLPASTYATLPTGFTRDAAGTVRNNRGAVVYLLDQSLRIHGSFTSTAVNAVQTGTGGECPKGLVLTGDYRGRQAGMLLLGAQPVRIERARLVVDVDPASASFPAGITAESPLDIDGLSIELRGETNATRRRYLVASTGSKVRRLRGVGDDGYIEIHRNALVQDCELAGVTGYYEGNRISRGSFNWLQLAGGANIVTEAYVAQTLQVAGATSDVSLVQMPAGATFAGTASDTVERSNYVGGVRRADKNTGGAAAVAFARAVHYDSQAVTASWVKLTGSLFNGSGWVDSTDTFTVTATGAGLYRASVWLVGSAAQAGTVGVRVVDGAGNAVTVIPATQVAAGAYRLSATNTINLSAGGTLRFDVSGTAGGTLTNGTDGTILLIERIG